MKKVISILLALTLFVTIIPHSLAVEPIDACEAEFFSFENDYGAIITLETTTVESQVRVNLYIDGVLAQTSVADSENSTVQTVVYDVPAGGRRQSSYSEEVGDVGGYRAVTVHANESGVVLEQANVAGGARRSGADIEDEPVDNSGLGFGAYGDGYYYLNDYSSDYCGPYLTALLYRKYNSEYLGETHYYQWTTGTTMSAIVSVLTSKGEPVQLILGVLVFTAQEVIKFTQASKIATYQNKYDYKVRIGGTVYYTAVRYKTYWRVDNTTTGTSQWELKSFDHGFGFGNRQMALNAMYAYVEATHG